MIQQNTLQKLVPAVLVYKLFNALLVCLFATLIIFNVPQLNNYEVIISAFLILWKMGYEYLWWMMFSYQITSESITINSGVIFRSSKTVQFNDVQSSTVHRGPLLSIFGLARLDGYTSSPAQLVITSSRHGSTTSHRPDISIILPQTEADEATTYVKKGDIQKVQAVA